MPVPCIYDPMLAASMGIQYENPLVVIAVMVVASTWVTSILLAYGALLLALKTRFSRRARIRPWIKQKRIPSMLRTSYRQGLLALISVVPYLGYNLVRFVTNRSHWDQSQMVEISKDLAEYVALAGPFAAAAIVPLGVSWLWMRRLRREEPSLPDRPVSTAA